MKPTLIAQHNVAEPLLLRVLPTSLYLNAAG